MRRSVILSILIVVAASLFSFGQVGAEPDDARYFPQTGHYVKGEFLKFFDGHGGIDVFGYPRTEQFVQGGRLVQYYQRQRMESWPENPDPYKVQLMLIGAAVFGPGQPPVASDRVPAAGDTDHRYFPETGHTIGAAFKEFFESRGDLEVFGYPITEPFTENGLTVQYFQRARFELHPELSPPYNVALGLLGDRYIFVMSGVPLAATLPVPQESVSDAPSGADVGKLAFQTATGSTLYSVGADGSGLGAIGSGMDPALSPDGSRIAYVSWDYPPGIYVMNRDGSDPSLVYGVQQARGPAWSPDGSSIAFYQKYQGFRRGSRGRMEPDDFFRILVLNLVDGKTWGPPNQPSHSFSPSWSPDGKSLVFKGDDGLYLVGEENPAKLLAATDSRFASPAWSPDGSRIAYQYRQHDHWEIGAMNADGTGSILLTTSLALAATKPNNVAPAWSPDGRQIAFVSDRDGFWRIYVMNADGRNQRLLTPVQVAYDWANERVMSWGH